MNRVKEWLSKEDEVGVPRYFWLVTGPIIFITIAIIAKPLIFK